MRHTPTSNPRSALGRVLGLGAVAGVRSMSAPALLSRAVSRGSIEGIESTPFAFLASPRTARILTVLAVGEALADKLPFLARQDLTPRPSRTYGLRRTGRGCPVRRRGASRGDRSGLGLLASAAASYPSYYLRVKTQQRLGLPNWAVGLVEDALAEGTGLLALRKR